MEIQFNNVKFRDSRKMKNFSQSQLAERAGTSERYIRAMEAGTKRNPSAIILYKAAQALGETVEAMMIMEDTEDDKP